MNAWKYVLQEYSDFYEDGGCIYVRNDIINPLEEKLSLEFFFWFMAICWTRRLQTKVFFSRQRKEAAATVNECTLSFPDKNWEEEQFKLKFNFLFYDFKNSSLFYFSRHWEKYEENRKILFENCFAVKVFNFLFFASYRNDRIGICCKWIYWELSGTFLKFEKVSLIFIYYCKTGKLN